MPAVPEWDVLLRGGVLRALGQRGCRSGWTVSNFRGRARLHITARAAGGHRRQLLLPYPWESDQLEAIRDGVVKLYGDFQEGVPLEQTIAELSAAAPQSRTPVPRSPQLQLSLQCSGNGNQRAHWYLASQSKPSTKPTPSPLLAMERTNLYMPVDGFLYGGSPSSRISLSRRKADATATLRLGK